jgi:hypothetical protein
MNVKRAAFNRESPTCALASSWFSRCEVTHPESGCVQRVRSPGAKTLPASLLPQPALESLFSWRIFGAGVG